MARVVVSGYMLRLPLPGNVLASFQYLLGLERLGHSVVYIEESGWPGSSYDPGSQLWSDYPVAGLQVARNLARQHRLDARLCFVNRETGVTHGVTWDELGPLLEGADLLLDVGGVCWLEEFQRCRRRALVDMDPMFTQVGRFASRVLGTYDIHFTYGTNIGRTGCSVPPAGFEWVATLPPVVPEMWPRAAAQPGSPYTTIASWSAYGGIEHQGQRYGQKDSEFTRVIDLPGKVSVPIHLALAGAGEEVLEQLSARGWRAFDAREVGADVHRYVDFISRSRGELSVAKHAYVTTRSGWVSDRTVCYLASGLPAIVQDTGIVCLPLGEGLLTFTNVAEAAECFETVEADHARHAGAALALASDVFSYRHVLPRLLAVAMEDASPRVAGAAR